MNKIVQLLIIAVATTLLASGCAGTAKTSSTTQASTAPRPYQGWTTAQLQSKRTQLMLASAQPNMTVDPVNGGTSSNWQASGINRELNAVNAELLLRDPSGKLLTTP